MARTALAVAAALGGFALSLPPAAAQAPFAGKTVQVVIGFGPGGGYDTWARTVGRHIGRHLPGNPTVVPQNMPGAGSFVAANHIYNVAPKDGSAIGVIARDAALGPLSKAPGVRFDATKFSWLGTPTKETNVCIAMNTAAVKSAQDLAGKELILGDTGPGTGTRTYPKALNGLLGWKFKLVGGFPASTDVFLAMERGEVEGICESYDSVKNRKPEWIASKRINILLQGGETPHHELKDVPFVLDFAKTPEQKQALQYLYAGQGIGRPFVAPPGLAPERLRMLREAFNATMKDPEFLAEAKRLNLDVEPEDGEHLEGLIKQIYATPEGVIEKIATLVK
jgi:tripartite-type tricarboxylate transporter receptor subunit TctC